MSISFWSGNISLESSAFSYKSSGYDLKQGKFILPSWKKKPQTYIMSMFPLFSRQCSAENAQKNLLLRHSSRRSDNEMHDSSSQQTKKNIKSSHLFPFYFIP